MCFIPHSPVAFWLPRYLTYPKRRENTFYRQYSISRFVCHTNVVKCNYSYTNKNWYGHGLEYMLVSTPTSRRHHRHRNNWSLPVMHTHICAHICTQWHVFDGFDTIACWFARVSEITHIAFARRLKVDTGAYVRPYLSDTSCGTVGQT